MKPVCSGRNGGVGTRNARKDGPDLPSERTGKLGVGSYKSLAQAVLVFEYDAVAGIVRAVPCDFVSLSQRKRNAGKRRDDA